MALPPWPTLPGAIDAYVEALPDHRRAKVAAAVAAIRDAVPGAAERIEWKMPVFNAGGRDFALASQKSCVSIYCCGVELAAELRAAAPKAKGGEACVNFSDGVDIPPEALAVVARKALC